MVTKEVAIQIFFRGRQSIEGCLSKVWTRSSYFQKDLWRGASTLYNYTGRKQRNDLTKDRAGLQAKAHIFGLDPDLLNKEVSFVTGGQRYHGTIIGLKPTNKKYPVLFTCPGKGKGPFKGPASMFINAYLVEE